MKEDREIIPLRTILQNCLNHIENLESNRSICDNYEKEFQDLKQFSETLKVCKEYACTEGEKEVNRKKNRYKDILPFNVSRVILSKYEGIPGSDYINANFIKGASGSPAYIASQGPLPNTVNDFWRMVVECEVQVIVMACNAEEAGKHKCENYWVEKEGEEKRFGMVEICLVKASTVCPDFLVRTMRLKYTNDKSVTEERTICQFHYSAWPDHGVPPLVRPLLDMVRLVRDTQASETLPVLVHCSAGCGRTGTICAIDFVWGLLRAGKLTEEFSLFNLVKDMRKQRVAMVQTKEQYILVHQAVRELFKEQLRVIESHPYENIDVNGVPLIKDFEEPLYDTIGPCKNNCDEKHDENEAEKSEAEKKDFPNNSANKDTAPPLPRKKRPNIPFSKHEKEVENLTEKNRCTNMEKEKEIMDVSPSNSLLSKPRIAKLKALFERSPTSRSSKQRGSQTVSRSHSLGAIRKPLFSEAVDNHSADKNNKSPVQPIPDGGKLKVPKLSLTATTTTTTTPVTTASSTSKPASLIKRSKSLKTISQPHKLSMLASVSPPGSVAVRDKSRKPSAKDSALPLPRPETVSKATFKKSVISQDLPSPQHPHELYKRRRSLESLIGDEPPVITWPTTVMFVPATLNNSIAKAQTSISPNKQTFKSSQSMGKDISADSIRQQFQNLTIEAQKKMNTLVSGIGIRERRNSFRQAISKDDAQIAKQNLAYEYIWIDPRKNKIKQPESKTIQVQPYPKNFNETLTVRTQNGEILHPSAAVSADQPDSSTVRMDDIPPNYQRLNTNKGENSSNKQPLMQRSKSQIAKVSSGDVHHSRFPQQQRPYELVRTLSSHAIQDKNSAFSVVRPGDDRRMNESKNLFLHRLNIEIQESKNMKPVAGGKITEPVHHRRGSEHPGTSEPVKFNEKGIVQDSHLSPKRKEVRSSGDERRETDQKWLYVRSYPTEKSAGTTNKPNPNFLGVHAFTESPQVFDSQQSYKEPLNDARKLLHKKSNNHQSPSSDGRRIDPPPPVKDTYAELDRLVHHNWLPPDSGGPEMKIHHGEYYPKKFDLHGVASSGGYGKKMVPSNHQGSSSSSSTSSRKPQIIEVRKKSLYSGNNSVSSHSSGDMSHSDQHSQNSDSPRIMDSHEIEGIAKPEIIRLKAVSHIKTTPPYEKKTLWDDGNSRHEHGSESSSSSSVRELTSVLPPKPPEEVYNYGIVASVKFKPNRPSHSRDDFLLGEPVAPPRVKRHASVKLIRQGTSEPSITHLSTWTSPEKKLIDSSNWNDALGVDLDAVAASMQRQKAESSGGSSDVPQSNKNYNTSSPPQFSYKKQQHYL